MRNLRNVTLVLILCAASKQTLAAAPRISGAIDDNQRVTLSASRTPMAIADSDTGRVPSGTVVQSVTLVFGRTSEQEADLASLVAAQHDAASPLYHRWLTPEEFADRFGAADADLAATKTWLESHGLAVQQVSRARNRLRFSGTAGQIGAAFATELHYYRTSNGTAFAPSADVSIPSALGGIVRSVGNLDSFRPKPHLRLRPDFTSNQSGSHFLTPADVATVYDLTPAYAAGLDGTGQSIAVVGQSSIVVADIENFQRAAGVPVHDPAVILVPGTGTSTQSSRDMAESDLDLEYTSSIAPGASIQFIYVGNNPNSSVWDATQYAVDNDVAPIISVSYGICEAALSSTDYAILNRVLEQAAAQGQSVIAAAGDAGSTDCAGTTGLSASVQGGLAVDFPASSQYVTGMGGSEITAAASAPGNTTFWLPATSADVIGSARSYMPEQVWNDDAGAAALASGGGGASLLTSRPSLQTGVPGIPTGTKRLVPDI